uniref:RING-type domain-containing protein n=1 Tax=Labrus bergylta TaxID=56723 RepID=A0A3Q3GVC7_9LABR
CKMNFLSNSMSCGHAVGPDYLTVWCLNQLKEGKYLFRCPALVEGTNKLCNKLLSYQEVCKMAALTVKEMEYFEETIARLAAAEFCEIKPVSRPVVEYFRIKFSIQVHCFKSILCLVFILTSAQSAEHMWRGQISPTCVCTAPSVQPIRRRYTISAGSVRGSGRFQAPDLTTAKMTAASTRTFNFCRRVRPSVCLLWRGSLIVRQCEPVLKCGLSVEHSSQYCKNINCPRCHIEFCFVCLKLKLECNKTSFPYKICPSGVAPRQTSIPVWQRK